MYPKVSTCLGWFLSFEMKLSLGMGLSEVLGNSHLFCESLQVIKINKFQTHPVLK
jgi:hypothetical protein